MDRSDWLTVGLKLLGVYFGVTGLASLWTTLLGFAAVSGHGVRFEGAQMFAVLQPAVFLLAAFFFIWWTRPTLNILGDHGRDDSA